MVRQKHRWLLVRFDFERHVLHGHFLDGGSASQNDDDVSTLDIFRSIRSSISTHFGQAGAGSAYDVQVKLYDSPSRLAMIRVPRDRCNVVRAAVTFLTSVKDMPVTASVINVNGSARTARVAAMRAIKRSFQETSSITRPKGDGAVMAKKEKQKYERGLLKLEERMSLVRSVE